MPECAMERHILGAHTYQEALAFDKKAIKPQEATNFMVVGPNWCSYMSGVHLSWEQNDKSRKKACLRSQEMPSFIDREGTSLA